jgi:preprotein translocase subunit SecG
MGFLTKLTTVVAVLFMVTSLILAFSSTRRAASVVKDRPAPSAPAESPQTPAVPEPTK